MGSWCVVSEVSEVRRSGEGARDAGRGDDVARSRKGEVAGGVAKPRKGVVAWGSEAEKGRGRVGAVDGRGRTTPPALNIDYPTNRALSYADNIVYRPPACL